jgi:hypothetical protein
MIYTLLFLIIFAPTPVLFFLFMFRKIENRAKKIIEVLPDDILIKYTDVKLWFKGYDIAKRADWFQIDVFKSLYVYNLADLYVFKKGIVVVGKAKPPWQFGRNYLLSPFAICGAGGEPQFTMVRYHVRYIGAQVIGEDVDIEFQDPDYTKNIKLAVKHIGRELYSKINSNA